MAIVPDLARPGDPVDPPLITPNRRVAGAPITLLLVPQFVGEVVQNVNNGDLWRATGLANNTWAPYSILG